MANQKNINSIQHLFGPKWCIFPQWPSATPVIWLKIKSCQIITKTESVTDVQLNPLFQYSFITHILTLLEHIWRYNVLYTKDPRTEIAEEKAAVLEGVVQCVDIRALPGHVLEHNRWTCHDVTLSDYWVVSRLRNACTGFPRLPRVFHLWYFSKVLQEA